MTFVDGAHSEVENRDCIRVGSPKRQSANFKRWSSAVSAATAANNRWLMKGTKSKKKKGKFICSIVFVVILSAITNWPEIERVEAFASSSGIVAVPSNKCFFYSHFIPDLLFVNGTTDERIESPLLKFRAPLLYTHTQNTITSPATLNNE